MTELLTSAQMRAAEQAAIATGKVSALELMERAGAGVVEAMVAALPALARGAHRARRGAPAAQARLAGGGCAVR